MDVTNSRICPSGDTVTLLTSINRMHFALAFIGRNSAYKVTLQRGNIERNVRLAQREMAR